MGALKVTPMQRPILVALLFVTNLATVAALAQERPTPTEIRPISAAEFDVLLEQARGNVVLVNLWATWCAPCLREIPELIKLRDKYAERPFRLIAVAMDDPADLETHVLPFREKHFSAWHTYQRAEFEMDRFVSVIDPGWNEVLPTSYLLDRNGAVARILFGGKSYEEFEAALLEVL